MFPYVLPLVIKGVIVENKKAAHRAAFIVFSTLVLSGLDETAA